MSKDENLLSQIKFLLLKAKEDLNDDMTKLAVKELPITINEHYESKKNKSQPTPSCSSSEKLEPLDLDL